MKTKQLCWTQATGWRADQSETADGNADLIVAFGARAVLHRNDGPLQELAARFPGAPLIGCSTAGEIIETTVLDDSLVATAIRFDHTRVAAARADIQEHADSRAAGRALARKLDPGGLSHVFVLSDGLLVNGTALVEGLYDELPAGVAVTGGLAGDGGAFEQTVVVHGAPCPVGSVIAVGFYGNRLRVGHGSLGGWDPFGPERLITRSHNNVLYELDGQSALTLYKKYLGDYSAGLPATGLLFPLSLRIDGEEQTVVRTILGVSEAEQSLTFAGDMPEGAYARLMRANFDRLIDGAHGAAQQTFDQLGDTAELGILVSCVGRKMVLKQRVEEEVESVRQVLGPGVPLIGFYSYGEISPTVSAAKCSFHNQTMTITTLSEAVPPSFSPPAGD